MNAQTPALHCEVEFATTGHLTLQPPQWFVLVFGSTHAFPQLSGAAGVQPLVHWNVAATATQSGFAAPQTALQRTVDNGQLGRISAVFLVVEAAATLIGAIAGPWLAESVSLHFAAMTAAAITAAAALVGAVTVPRVMLATKRSNEQAETRARTQ